MSVVRIVDKASNTDGWQARWPIPDGQRRCWTKFYSLKRYGGLARAYDLATEAERAFKARAKRMKR